MERYTFQVSGMSCAGCERIIEGELGDLAFVDRVRADHGVGEVSLTTDATSRERITGTIESLGYNVTN